MRRLLASLVLVLLAVAPAAAFAATPAGSGPVVDVIEIAGVLDRPLHRYALERLFDAERSGAALVVFQVDSLGGLKIAGEDELLPELVQRVRDARVPVAVHVGPRDARAGGAALYLATAAHIASMGPSGRVGPGFPVDFAHESRWTTEEAGDAFEQLAAARGRTLRPERRDVYLASQALRAGLVDVVVPSLAELLRRADGRRVTTAQGPVTLRLPEAETTVRFFQPGPLRRFLHAFANPALVYLCLIAGVLLIVFELFQPGFGVAGVSGGLLLACAGYGMTVLPLRVEGVIALVLGLGLLTLDVARDEIYLPTAAGTVGLIAGSLALLPGGSDATRLSPWLIGSVVAGSLIFFVPAMTVVRRARKPIATEAKRKLIGEPGEVRSILNPEGFVWVTDELWRARSEDGTRLRVGERVVVSRVDGTVLIVRPAEVTNGARA